MDESVLPKVRLDFDRLGRHILKIELDLGSIFKARALLGVKK